MSSILFVNLGRSKGNETMISRLSSQLTKKQVLSFCPELKLGEDLICSDQIRPCSNVNIYIDAHMHTGIWGLIPASASNDLQQHNRIGVLVEHLSNAPTYRLLARKKRGFLLADAFYHNTIKGGKRSRHQFEFKDKRIFAIPLVYDEWIDPEDHQRKLTFALLHHRIKGSDNQLPGNMPILLRDMNEVRQWLHLDNRPAHIQWPKVDLQQLNIRSKELDVKMNPGYKAVFPSGEFPEDFKNIA